MSIRSVFIIIISIIIFISISQAKKKKEKAGKVRDNIFHDSKYNFQLKLPEKWKRKIHKKDDVARITLTTKIYKDEFHNRSGIPKNQLGNYTDPIISFWIVECDLSMYDLLDSIITNGNYKKLKDKLLSTVRPVWEDAEFKKFRVDFRKEIYTCGQDAIHWIGDMEYSLNFGRDYLRADQGVAFTCLDINEKYNMFIVVRTEPELLVHVLHDLKPYVDSIRFENINYEK